MTTQTDESPRCTDPSELRQGAESKRNRAAMLKYEALSLERGAAQDEYEARLWEVADAAEDAWTALRERTAGLEAAAEGSLTAERAVHDRLREDRKHLAQRKGQATRAENSSNREAQDEAQVRLRRSEQRVAQTETELAGATARRMTDEVALETHQAALRDAHAAYVRALDAGFNPGTAAGAGALRFGVSGASDMTEDQRALYAALLPAMALAFSSGGSTPAPAGKGGLGTTRGELAAMDPSKFRLVRNGRGMIAIPPAQPR